jgi:hypothetical protein
MMGFRFEDQTRIRALTPSILMCFLMEVLPFRIISLSLFTVCQSSSFFFGALKSQTTATSAKILLNISAIIRTNVISLLIDIVGLLSSTRSI